MNRRTGLIFFFFFLICISWVPAQNTLVRTTDEEVYHTAVELLDQEKYGAAREFFQRYINLQQSNHLVLNTPNTPYELRLIDCEYYIAYCALNLFNDDAESLFRNFIAKYPAHSKASLAYYDLGTFYYNNKKYDKAIDYFEKTDESKLSANQKSERTFKLGYSYFNQKDFDKAEPYFNQLKSGINKYSYASSYYAGYIELKNGKYDEALADLKKAEENDAYKPIVPSMIATVYYWQGNYDELISYSEKVLASSDKNIQGKDEMFLLTADAYYQKNNYTKASEYFQKLVNENRSKVTPEIKYRFGYSLYKNRDVQGAINQFKDLAGTKDSIQQASAYYLGLSYLQSGKKDFALPAFDLARKADFNKSIQEEALFNYAKINFELQRYHEAISALKSFSKSFPDSKYNNEVQELLSESFLRTSNYAEALSYIESLRGRSLRINKAYQSVTFYSGAQLFNNEKFQDAIVMFDKSTEYPIDKDIFLAASFWKGEAYSALKDYPAAIRSYSTVFQKTNDPDEYFLKSRYGIGYAYYNLKEYDKALPHFRIYVETLKYSKDKENYDDALLRLADLYFQKKEYDKAVDFYNQAITAKVKELDHAYYYRGIVYGTLKKIPEAEKSFDMVINGYPQSIYHDDAIFEKAMLEFQNGNLEAAAQGFSDIINKYPNSTYVPDALLRRAGVYANLDKNEAAENDYENILTNYASSSVAEDAFIGLQQLYNKEGKIEDFRKWIDTMQKINPQNETLVSARFNTGTSLYFAQKYPQAIEALNNFVNTYPDNQDVPEARYDLGDSYLKTGDTANASTNFKLVIQSHDPSYSMKAVQKMADIDFKKGVYAEAMEYYKILEANARNKREKTSALLGLMQISYLTSVYDSSIFYSNEIKKQGNATLDAESKATLYLGKSYYAKKEYDKAIDYFLNTINLAKDRNAAEAQYLVGEIQYDQKKYRQSLETLNQLNNSFSEYEDWVGKSFLLIADDLIALNEIFQAKATLNSIIENSNDKTVVEKAKAKLATLTEQEGKEEKNDE